MATVTVPGSDIQFTFPGMGRGGELEFWVAGRTAAGPGPGSEAVAARARDPAPARITSFSSQLSFPLGQTARLPCRTVGRPPPRLTWLQQGRPVPDGQVLSDGTLVVGRAGQYECQVENSEGRDRILHEVVAVRPPAAPTLRVSRITSATISLAWAAPHNGGALLQGYFLQVAPLILYTELVCPDISSDDSAMFDCPTQSLTLKYHSVHSLSNIDYRSTLHSQRY